jgi:hypothetical protein
MFIKDSEVPIYIATFIGTSSQLFTAQSIWGAIPLCKAQGSRILRPSLQKSKLVSLVTCIHARIECILIEFQEISQA